MFGKASLGTLQETFDKSEALTRMYNFLKLPEL